LVLPAATPFTVLPSVSSLKALRQVAKASKVTVRTSACVLCAVALGYRSVTEQ
jgi:hypothetical protein